jgi:uncharacterized membrane protein YsdA (DUF1294 family)
MVSFFNLKTNIMKYKIIQIDKYSVIISNEKIKEGDLQLIPMLGFVCGVIFTIIYILITG